MQEVQLVDAVGAGPDGEPEADDGTPGRAPAQRSALGSLAAALPRLRRFLSRWWPVLVVLAVAISMPAAAHARAERTRLADLADVRGMLAPLDGPVRELWVAPYPIQPWTFDVGGVLIGARLRFDSPGGTVATGVDAQTGAELWSVTLDSQPGGYTRCVLAGGPATGPDRAVLVCVVVDKTEVLQPAESAAPDQPAALHLAVIDSRSGTVLRELPFGPTDALSEFGADVAIVTMVDERIDGGGGDGGVAARRGNEVSRVDPRTGETRWSAFVPASDGFVYSASVQPVGDQLVVSAGDQVSVFSAAGSLLRSWADVGATDGRLTQATASGRVLQWTYADNAPSAITDLETGATLEPAADDVPLLGVDDGSMGPILLTGGSALTAWDLETGAQRWREEGVVTEVLVVAGRVYSVRDGVLRAQDARTGRQRWAIDAPSAPESLSTDGRSLLTLGRNEDGTGSSVRALDLDDASERWAKDLSRDVLTLDVVAGRLFAQTADGLTLALG